ncbi:MAG: 16S rRNA (cytidine(1402)-2'-O)-methyltransferase [Acidimicrobiia bacterium]
MTGTLILCATPIGNLGDAPPRLGEALRTADVVYAEDTRRSSALAKHLGANPTMRSFFAGNEEQRSTEIRERLESGETVALLTDAGTPALSDPGFLAVKSAIEAGATVTVVPGPSAVTAALAVAGLPAERFTFEGFLPRRGSARRKRLAAVAPRTETTVLFASPSRIGRDLADIAAIDPDRNVVVARELTKMYEEVWRGSAAEAAAHWAEGGRGEFTVVIAGHPEEAADLEASAARVLDLVAGGEAFAEAVREIAETDGVPRRGLYEEALRRRDV